MSLDIVITNFVPYPYSFSDRQRSHVSIEITKTIGVLIRIRGTFNEVVNHRFEVCLISVGTSEVSNNYIIQSSSILLSRIVRGLQFIQAISNSILIIHYHHTADFFVVLMILLICFCVSVFFTNSLSLPLLNNSTIVLLSDTIQTILKT